MKLLLRLSAWLAFVPYVLVVVLVMSGSPTWSGVAYLGGMGILLGGLMTLPTGEKTDRQVFGRKWPRGLSRAGAVAIVCVMFVRCCSAGAGESMQMAESARFVDRIVDERDIALSGTRVLVASGMLHDDRNELPGAMREAYKKMGEAQGDAPSPVLATYLGLQGPKAYDMLLIAPMDQQAPPTDAVIFLHGFAGNFALPCWQVADAMKGLNVLTACPSTRWIGDWSSENGEATLRDVVSKLTVEHSITRIVLVGLSNGGFGASMLAPKMKGSFAGVVLISGAHEDAASTGVPTLLIHGRADTMADYGDSVAYRHNHANTTLVTIDAGHFAMLVKSAETNKALRDFVVKVTGRGALTARRSP